MSSSAPDVVESSPHAGKEPAEQEATSSRPAGKEPMQEAPPAQRKWVALVSAAVLLGNGDQRAQEMGDTTTVLLDLDDPPLPSYLDLHPRLVPDPRHNDGPLSAYILAALDRSPYILLQFVEDNLPDFFLCNTDTRAVSLLPPVPANIQARGHNIRPNLSIGLIADPQNPGHHVVAQLHPSTFLNEPDKLLYFSTAKGLWFTRGLYQQQAPMRNPFSETGVFAHNGRLWWIALAYGVFFCDPCTPVLEIPQLRFLRLPGDCEMEDDVAFDPRIRTLLDERRCVRPSDGKLRFVEIRGLSYVDNKPAANPTVWMWTLDDPEAADPNNAWTFAYEVAFAKIWNSETYGDAGLPREVPHVALVDPDNHFVVYFFQGSKLFGFHMRDMKVVACRDCVIDRDQLSFRSSRPIVDAWVPPPPPPPQIPGDDDLRPDDNVWSTKSYDKQMEVTKSVHSWLKQAHLEWTRNTDPSVENWRAWKMAPPSSDGSSVNSGSQADDELQFYPSP